MAFHSKDGWFFERESDGSVSITKCLPIYSDFAGFQRGWPVEYVRLDADTWASVVASVSAGGETSDSFAKAQAMHTGTTGSQQEAK